MLLLVVGGVMLCLLARSFFFMAVVSIFLRILRFASSYQIRMLRMLDVLAEVIN